MVCRPVACRILVFIPVSSKLSCTDLMILSTCPCLSWPATGQRVMSMPFSLCKASLRSLYSISAISNALIPAESLSQKTKLGQPTSQLSLVNASIQPAAFDDSMVCKFTSLVVGQTAVMTQHFASSTFLFLVSLSNPGTVTVIGPNRSTWQVQKGGARVSWWSDIGPISTFRYFFLFMMHIMQSSANSLYKVGACRMETFSADILVQVSTPLCLAMFQ